MSDGFPSHLKHISSSIPGHKAQHGLALPTFHIPTALLPVGQVHTLTFCSLNVPSLFLSKGFRFCCFCSTGIVVPRNLHMTGDLISPVCLTSDVIHMNPTNPSPHSALVPFSLSYRFLYIFHYCSS